ncbi:DUF3825 domain-containing protein [Prevotella sp.]|uniref:DUF3825 domain-containing protein n=1 Tax=Prevotella sp. TaxID=59823 RepID=UPI0025F529D4|nr:DUF3825 domain-containing protein [Prevotella sp.]
MKKKIEGVFKTTVCDTDGWVPFAIFGQKISRSEYEAMGFLNIREVVRCLFGKRIEFRQGDISKHEAPVQVRDLKMVGREDFISTPTTTRLTTETFKPKQGSYLGNELDKYAYFPRPKDMPGLKGWDAAVNSLAVNLALEERWYYDDADKQNRPILKNYLSFTFQRLQYEDKLEKEAAAKNNRQPRLKILENQQYAVWNTGLVDNIYDPIYAYFMRNDGRTPTIKQPWVFMGFNTANSSQQKIMSSFPYRPERASYFNDPRELLYDTRATEPTLDWDHFLKDNISRLPIGFIKKGYADSFPFVDDPSALPKQKREEYYRSMADAIYADDDWKQFVTTRFRNAVTVALARVAWNYKTAIPVYYPTAKKLQLLLPLALEDKKRIDVALVCNHVYKPEERVNNYEGRTIFTLQMAYNNARLITRPDSDWLMADMAINK